VKLFHRKAKAPKKIGLALGGGGARGLAHLHVFEALDELGVRPHAISGTSIGAVMGSLYASGLSGLEIRNLVDQLLVMKVDKFSDVFTRRDVLKWVKMIDPVFHKGALLRGERFIQFLAESMACTTFEELEIPLRVSTTDYCKGIESVFDSGDLLSAVHASMAIPGIFSPVEREGRLLVDGGLVNPLPYNLLRNDCDFIIAVDVSGSLENPIKPPGFFDAMFSSFSIVQASLISKQLQVDPPDIYLKPNLHGIRLLEFHKSEQILTQSESIRTALLKSAKEFV